jgi:hypothetical protein
VLEVGRGRGCVLEEAERLCVGGGRGCVLKEGEKLCVRGERGCVMMGRGMLHDPCKLLIHLQL